MSSPTFVDLSDSFGAILIGAFAAAALYGVSCLQTFLYYVNYPTDKIFTRCMVALLWAVDTVHQVSVIAALWHYLIPQAGNLDLFALTNNLLSVCTFTGGLVSVLVQGFFVYRIYNYGRTYWPLIWIAPALLVPAILAELGLSLYFVYMYAQSSLTSGVISGVDLTMKIVNGLAVGIDLTITGCLMAMIQAGFLMAATARTEKMLLRFMGVLVNTGTWTAAFGVIVLILILVYPETQLYTIAWLSISPLYCNTLLGTLNTRKFIREGLYDSTRDRGTINVPKSNARSSQRAKIGPSNVVNVAIHTSTHGTTSTPVAESIDLEELQVGDKSYGFPDERREG